MLRQIHRPKRFPSGDSYPLTTIRFSPHELSERYHLEFTEAEDDLDLFLLAVIALPDGMEVWLERHVGDPVVGTLAHVDSLADPKLAFQSLTSALSLKDTDLEWVSPRVTHDKGLSSRS